MPTIHLETPAEIYVAEISRLAECSVEGIAWRVQHALSWVRGPAGFSQDSRSTARAAEVPPSAQIESEQGRRVLATVALAELLAAPNEERFQAAARHHGLPVIPDFPEFQFSARHHGAAMMPAADAPSALSANGMSNTARRTASRRSYQSTPAEPGRTFRVDIDLGRLREPPQLRHTLDTHMTYHHLPFGGALPPTAREGGPQRENQRPEPPRGPRDPEPRGGPQLENPPFQYEVPFLHLDRQGRVYRQAARAAAQAVRAHNRAAWAENERQHRRTLVARQARLGASRALRATQRRAAEDAQWDDVHIPRQGLFVPGPGSGNP
jgi:hypothetical protein